MRRALLCHPFALFVAVATIAPVPAETLPITYTEPLKRTWTHEVLGFHVEVPRGEWRPEDLFVTDEAGTVIPTQVSDVLDQHELKAIPLTVWLVSDFAPWQKRTWQLHYGKPGPTIPAADFTVKEERDAFVLANDRLAIRTGRGEQHFAKAVDPRKVPAPIVAVRGPSGSWIGRGWLEAPRRVTGYAIRLVDDGPIFKRVRAEYAFEGGRYVCTITLRTGEEVIHFREEFDLGDPSPARDANFCFSFTDGLKPNTVRWYGRPHDKRFNRFDARAAANRESVFTIDYAKPERLLRLHGLFTWWPQAASYYAAYRENDPASDLVAIFPERPGHWRNPTAIFLETTKDKHLVMRAPLRQPVQEWVVDGVDYLSPYYTGTVYPGTPRNQGVREWGMLVTRAAEVVEPENDSIETSGIRKTWSRYGQNPLDKIKEWTLSWPAPGAEAYPRGAITPDKLPALRERAGRILDLKKLVGSNQHKFFTYLVTQDPKLGDTLLRDRAGGDANWMGLLPKLRYSVGCYLDTNGDLGNRTFMHHGNYHIVGAAPVFDVALSVPSMTPDERREALAAYAFLLYKLSDSDWLAYGAGFHLGNPNMPTMSLSQLGAGAALVPEHLMAADWMLRSVSSNLHMLRDYTAPGGAWRECPHYQMDASLSGVLQVATAFQHAGLIDLYQNPFLKATMLYHVRILTPVDPRFGIRTMPAIGNGSYEPTGTYGRMAAGTAASDPAYSAWMQWAWKAVGAPYHYKNDELVNNEDLPAVRPDLSSRHFPGFGTVMRSHVGAADETYLLFRMGYQHEHYENEQGEIVLYARGVPLCMDFGSTYQPSMRRPWLHNRIAINHKVDHALGEITENNLLDAADSCLGNLTVREVYPIPEDPWEKTPPNAGPPPEPLAPTTWTRQVVLVKNERGDGPQYVVVRDGFEGAGDDFTEFSLWNLATEVNTDGNVATFSGQHGVDLAVTMLNPAVPAFTTGEYGHKFLAGNTVPFWRAVNGKKPFEEVQRYLRVKRTDHNGYFAVLYPYKPGEEVPTFSGWDNGAGVQATIGDERHTVVCAERPGTFKDGGVAFEGQRAMVRQGKDRLVLALLTGQSLQAGGYGLRGPGPTAVTVAGGKVVGEANLTAAGEVFLRFPAAPMVATIVIQTGEKEEKRGLALEDTTARLALPAGRCVFRLE